MLDSILSGIAGGPAGALLNLGGSLLSSVFGADPNKEKMQRIVDPYTQQAASQNEQQRSLYKSQYGSELAGANRTANRLMQNTQQQAIGAQAQTGMSDNATTKALMGMASGNLGRDMMDTATAAHGRYADRMANSNEFTKGLASDVNLRFSQESPNTSDRVGGFLGNMSTNLVNNAYNTEVYRMLNAGKKQGPMANRLDKTQGGRAQGVVE